MKRRIRLTSWPMLTLQGFLLALTLLLGPVLGLALSRSFHEALFLSGLTAAALLIILLLDFIRVRAALDSLEFAVDAPDRVYSDRESTLQCTVTASKPSSSFRLTLRPHRPAYCRVENDRYLLSFPRGKQTSISFVHRFHPLNRDRLVLSPATFRIRAPGGFSAWQGTVELEELASIRVLPNPWFGMEDKPLVLRPIFGGQTLARKLGSEGREFDSLRPYTHGDDLRRIDWKRTAKRESPVVRVYRPESHQRMLIFIDCSRRMGNRVDARLQLDYACDAAASLGQLALSQKDEVGLYAFSHRALIEIDSSRGRLQQTRMLDELADLRAEHLDPDYTLVTRWAHASRRRALIVLITSIMNPASVENVRTALRPLVGRHLPLLAAMSDRSLDTLSLERAESMEQAFVVSAATEQLSAIRQRQNNLQRAGIESVYTDARFIGPLLGEKYLQLKQRGKI